jgi:uncharacterized protein
VTITLDRDRARQLLIAHLGLTRPLGRGARGTRAVLDRLRCIQLDPLDVLGTNADLVVMARTEGVGRGDVWRHLFPSHAFEHFAKERCILPAEAFPWYRAQGHRAQTPWWGHGEREKKVAPALIESVLEEVRARGPVSARELSDRGAVVPMDWSGWMGTSKATSMALEILWTRCDVVVAGRTETGGKIYDVPERALGAISLEKTDRASFARWALLERVRSAGLLSRAGGSTWSMLADVRTSPLIDALLEEGILIEVAFGGSPRRYLTLPAFLEQRRASFDDRVRILGPLDPLLWDRALVRLLFDFEYVWEVYKPEHLRKWGWYVCPLLHRDRLIGRIDARLERNALVVSKLWLESNDEDVDAIREALQRHAELCGASKVRLPKKAIRQP